MVEGRIVELLGLRSGAILSNDRDEKLFSQLLILSIQKIIVGYSTFQVLHPILIQVASWVWKGGRVVKV